jgi:4,5-DOPA dioxygenase extradiol
VLVHMYPERNIPVFQISIDADATPQAHYRIGKELAVLREQGVLLFGTGNIVHNLRMVDWEMENKGFEWAYEFDDFIKQGIKNGRHEDIINYASLGETAKLAVPIADHFNPILYILGASDKSDGITVYNEGCVLGSLSMTGYLIG